MNAARDLAPVYIMYAQSIDLTLPVLLMERSVFYYISDESLFKYTVFSSSAAFSMPKAYLKSQTPPTILLMTGSFGLHLNWSPLLAIPQQAGILGINKASDLQYIIMPT